MGAPLTPQEHDALVQAIMARRPPGSPPPTEREIAIESQGPYEAARGSAVLDRQDQAERAAQPSAREQWLAQHPESRNEDDGPAPTPPPGSPEATAQQQQPQDLGPAPPPSPVFVPGGWMAATRTGRLPVDEGIKQEVAGADALHEQAIQQGADAATAQNDAEAAHFTQLARGVRGVDTYTARREGDREAAMRGAQIKLEEAVDAVNNSPEITPWHGKSDASRFMAILGVALGGAAAARTGGQNQALAILDKAIDQNIEAQKANLAAKRGVAAERRSVLGALREQFGDERQAEAAAKVAYLSRAEMELKGLAAQSKNKDVQARATELLAELQDKRAQRMLQFQQLEQGNLHEVYRSGGYVGGGAGGSQPVDAGRLVRMPDGTVRIMPTVDEGKKAREGAGVVSNIQANLDEALRIRKEASPLDLLNPYSATSKRLASLQSETAQMVTVARGQGAMSKGDQEVADNAIGSMTGILGSNDEVLKSTRDRFGKQFERGVTAAGGEHAATGYAYDAKGNLVPRQAYIGKADQPAPVVRKVPRHPIGGGE